MRRVFTESLHSRQQAFFVEGLLVLLGEIGRTGLFVVKSGYENANHAVSLPLRNAEIRNFMNGLSERALKSTEMSVEQIGYRHKKTCVGCCELIINMYVPGKCIFMPCNGIYGEVLITNFYVLADTKQRIVVSDSM
jgi:hypothetical protein